jgi:release factor glutamine methyltransferase
LEAAILLCHLLGKPRSFLHSWSERILTPEEASGYRTLLERRLRGEPIAHIIGWREFWSLALKVTSATLIPRPETELLVERALQLLQGIPNPRLAELGTGSGAIALAIASERPDCRIDATDISGPALEVAEENAQRLRLSQVRFYQGHWFEALPKGSRYHMIMSNPPYVAAADPHLTQGDLPHEPLGALLGGPDGLDHIRELCTNAAGYLTPGGWLLLEHGFDQGAAVRRLYVARGLVAVGSHLDLADQERLTEGRRPGALLGDACRVGHQV